MSHGSTTLFQLVTSLGGERRHNGEIVRNLLYLIAAGELTPFMQPFNSAAAGNHPEFASERIKRMFSHAAAAEGAGHIASEVVGSGVEVSPGDALTVIDCLAVNKEAETQSASAELIPRLKRLGLLV